MKRLNMLYTDKEECLRFLTAHSFNCQSPCLARIYTARSTPEQAVQIAQEVRMLLPCAEIMGVSGYGVIFEGIQYDDGVLLAIEQFEQTHIRIDTYCFEGKSAAEMAQAVAQSTEGLTVDLMHILCGGHYVDAHSFIEELNARRPGMPVTGGMAGDIAPLGITGYVFTENGAQQMYILTCTLYGGTLHVHSEVGTAHETISPAYTLEQCQDSLLLQIDGVQAVDWCREQFGMEDLCEHSDGTLITENDALIRFPLVLEGHGGAIRFIKYDSSSEQMSLYYSCLPDGTKVRIGYTSPLKCVQECFDICERLTRLPVESLFCYVCMHRKLYMSNCAEWELRPFWKHGVCGVFMTGEFGWSGKRNELYNGANSMVGIAEKMVFLTPDFGVFEDLYKIRDDEQELSSFVLKKQSSAMSRENQKLLEKLLQQQELAKTHLYVDNHTGLCNAIKFAQDNQLHAFDKLCMIQIENAHLIIARFGRKWYFELLKKALREMCTFTRALPQAESYFFYTLNEHTFFAATVPGLDEEVFMDAVRAFYERYHVMNLGERDDLLISRFVTVRNQKNMLEKALHTLQGSKDMQTHFLLCDHEEENNHHIVREMEMLHILNQVLENGWMVPHYQGIRDNLTGEIGKYEALMRIHDANNYIYAPADFMDIAKKYHLYVALSRMMIERVFHRFGGTDVVISINLSVYDFTYDSQRQFIMNSLEQLGDAGNFIFEILEDEQFRDMDVLHSFIKDVRKYGVGIAIDDFGRGYSSFMEIATIDPDFIKIDGSIVKSVGFNELSKKVMTNIAFLGQQLDAQLVAEFVENESIQQHMEELGIRFSQGYYFARPVPVENLRLTAK